MTIFSSGISMYAMARLIQTLKIFDAAFLRMNLRHESIFDFSIFLSGIIVLAYILLGGLTSAIYNEVLQFFLIVAGFFPLVWLGLRSVGGWQGLSAKLPEAFTHSWHGMSRASTNPLGVEWFGLVAGLGFVLSFGYWCTDFLVVQRAMAADSMSAARRTPLIAAVPKMFFPFLVILPGLIAVAVPATMSRARAEIRIPANGESAAQLLSEATAKATTLSKGLIPPKVDGRGNPIVDSTGRPQYDYDLAIPMMLLHYFPAGILGLGLTALLASFMSGMAGNVTAFNTVWTYDIYHAYLNRSATDEHLLWMGRMATVFGIVLSIAAAYVAVKFNNIMDMLQLVFAFVNAPLFATFLLGMFWKRATGHGAFIGLLTGTAAAALHHGLTLPLGQPVGIKGGWIAIVHLYPSEMAQNFWTAIFAWSSCFIVTILVSIVTKPREDRELVGLVYSLTERPKEENVAWYSRPGVLAVIVLGITLLLNVVFW
jgi:SSS family solute:Na+ symporter